LLNRQFFSLFVCRFFVLTLQKKEQNKEPFSVFYAPPDEPCAHWMDDWAVTGFIFISGLVQEHPGDFALGAQTLH
jgi:hypothetical protein